MYTCSVCTVSAQSNLHLPNHIQHNLSEILQKFVNREHENETEVTVVVTEIDLVNNSAIIFELHLVGTSANKTLQELLNDINSSRQGLDIGIGVLKVCDQKCTSSTSENNDKKDKVSFSQLLLIVLVTLFVAFSVILTFFSLLACYMR